MTQALPYRRGVGIMLINDDRQVFVAQRLDSTFDAWQMPQGGVDDGEAWDAAALRELEEETGVHFSQVEIIAKTSEPLRYDLPDDIRKNVWKGRFRGQEQHWYLMRFLGTDSDINIDTDHPEFSCWKWCHADDVVANIVPFKRDLYAQIIAHFADHLRG